MKTTSLLLLLLLSFFMMGTEGKAQSSTVDYHKVSYTLIYVAPADQPADGFPAFATKDDAIADLTKKPYDPQTNVADAVHIVYIHTPISAPRETIHIIDQMPGISREKAAALEASNTYSRIQ